MKVIGAGFGRTGTLSIKEALEELGFGPCYHMSELAKNPEHPETWRSALRGKYIDWKKLFEGYQATVDWPGCTHYKELMEAYPDAKVLLNLRHPERWYESTRNTIHGLYKIKHYFMTEAALAIRAVSVLSDEPPARLSVPTARQHPAQENASPIWDGTFSGRFEDREYAIEVFNRHNEEVKRHVPPDRLLVYEVKEGWEPLCEFLGVEVPEGKPFPRLNESAGFWDLPIPKQARERFEEHRRFRVTEGCGCGSCRCGSATTIPTPVPEDLFSGPEHHTKSFFFAKKADRLRVSERFAAAGSCLRSVRTKTKSIVGVHGTARGTTTAAAREKHSGSRKPIERG